jgi:hypothetical protein
MWISKKKLDKAINKMVEQSVEQLTASKDLLKYINDRVAIKVYSMNDEARLHTLEEARKIMEEYYDEFRNKITTGKFIIDIVKTINDLQIPVKYIDKHEADMLS